MDEQNNQVVDKNTQPMSVKDWLITFLIMLIPFVNLVMIFVWAFGSNVNLSKKNFFKAYLIILAIFIVLWIGLMILGVASVALLSSSLRQ